MTGIATTASSANDTRPIDNPKRCFICLTDEDASDAPGTWVDPCPCTLEAHQDCILSWVTDCERSNRPLKCPVCKSLIELEGRWDPIVALSDGVKRRFTRASPYMLFTAVSMGVQFSLQMYGAMALWTFAGKDALLSYALGPVTLINGRENKLSFARERASSALVLMNVAPALMLATVFPGFSNRIFLPTASLYGVYHVLHDEKFIAWPPSPQLAMAVFPYIRSIYYNLWRELVLPYEVKLNRQLLGLPPQPPPPEGAPHRRLDDRREPGVVEMLQTLVDALGGEEDEGMPAGANNANEEGEDRVVLEVVIEEDDGQGPREPGFAIEIGQQEDEAQPAVAPAQPAAGQAPNNENAAVAPAVDGPVPVPGAGDGQPAEAAPDGANHEAPAPPAQRMSLGGILSHLSNTIVSALILPGISFAAGEALRLVLPAKFTSLSSRSQLLRQRPGLLQQQWGRSLIGGCIFVVLRDIVRVYAKTRKVAAMESRRVKNVDRPRKNAK